MKMHENQGYKSIANHPEKINPTTVDTVKLLEALKRNGKKPTTPQNRIILDKSTTDKIEAEKEAKTRFQVNEKPTKKGKSKKTKTAEAENPFLEAVEKFEAVYIENGYAIPDNDVSLYQLSKAIAFSVIKKLIDVSADKTMQKLRAEAVKNFMLLDNHDKRQLTDTTANFDSNGNIKLKVNDEEYTEAVKKTLADTLSQGLDIVNEASILIIAEAEAVKKRNGKKPLEKGFMLKPYEARKTNGKTFVLNGKKVVEWSTFEAVPIKNIFKGVRKYIQDNKSIRAVINGYSYIEAYSIDSDSEAIEKIYYRLDKYADLGGVVYDFNGKELAYTTEAEAVKTYQDLLADLIIKANFDMKHIDFIRCRVCGKSLVDTAKSLGVSLRTAERIQADLQNKAVGVGFGTAEMLPKPENASAKKAVEAIDPNGKKYTFESVKSASVKLNIDRSNITAVLNGKRSTAKGYRFSYIVDEK